MAEGLTVDDDVKKKSGLRPPNYQQYEEQLELLQQDINRQEAELKSYSRPRQTSHQDPDDWEALLSQLKAVREEKEGTILQRKSLDERLKDTTLEVKNLSDALSKLAAGLSFTTEEGVDDAILKLQRQLNTGHFKLVEENRIIKEINSLQRSKKKVKEYLQKKQYVKEQKECKAVLKAEREKYFRLVSSLKTKEDAANRLLTEYKARTNEAWTRYRESGPERLAIKKDIDELYERRRLLVSDYRLQKNRFHIQLKQQRVHSFKRREDERRAQEERRQRAWEDYDASMEPYEDERQTCTILINYLRRFAAPEQEHVQATAAGDSPTPLLSNSASSSMSSSLSFDGDKLSPSSAQAEYIILKKKAKDDDMFFPSSVKLKKKRSGRKLNRKPSWLMKPIRHTAQIFSQFDTLGLKAPSTMAEISNTIRELQHKKDDYEAASRDAQFRLNPPSEYPLSNITRNIDEAASSEFDATVDAMKQLRIDDSPGSINSEDNANPTLCGAGSSSSTTLPRIDIQTAQAHSAKQQHSPGVESAPETPNSVESLDSGIGIHRRACTAPSSSVGDNSNNFDDNANTSKIEELNLSESECPSEAEVTNQQQPEESADENNDV